MTIKKRKVKNEDIIYTILEIKNNDLKLIKPEFALNFGILKLKVIDIEGTNITCKSEENPEHEIILDKSDIYYFNLDTAIQKIYAQEGTTDDTESIKNLNEKLTKMTEETEQILRSMFSEKNIRKIKDIFTAGL